MYIYIYIYVHIIIYLFWLRTSDSERLHFSNTLNFETGVKKKKSINFWVAIFFNQKLGILHMS